MLLEKQILFGRLQQGDTSSADPAFRLTRATAYKSAT